MPITANNPDSTPTSRHRLGFTVAEMMIVVAIIGTLLAIAVPSYSRARTKTRINQAQGQLEIIANAVRQLLWDTGKFPNGSTIDTPGTIQNEVWNLTPNSAGLLGTVTSTYGTIWRGPYLRALPLDPWGQPYFYDSDYLINGVNHMVVGSFGPNRVGQNVYDSDDIYIVIKK